ncbi:BatD family protein [Aeromonas cavernicola]|uniref:Protein BatD n=1 Tax=Aeromonas cavernicola TaxID=1006623 RepID=A0A2H9U7T4_9GAMM|nr:BatD family protein [Aeromonas cavernicola]PJG60074.1 hypothetical protein CUC53_04020 [Aeromonas cavernicola]
MIRLLIVEADGAHPAQALEHAPLLRRFAVGRITVSRVDSANQQLTRWQIPLHLAAASPSPGRSSAGLRIPPLAVGNQMTPAITIPAAAANTGTPDAPPHSTLSPLALQANLLHQGPLYPGQPVIYQLVAWLPTHLADTQISEPFSPHVTLHRLGEDEWLAPMTPNMPGRLTRSWLLQAHRAGTWRLDSPRLQGALPQTDGTLHPLFAQAAPLTLHVAPAPQQPVASRLRLQQHLEPAEQGLIHEPLIRTVTLIMEGGDGRQVQLTPVLSRPLPAGINAHPDGEQQQERFLANGGLLFEKRWRQTLLADQPGQYHLPAIELPWFNTQTGQVEVASLPAQGVRFSSPSPTPDPTTGAAEHGERLSWVLLALLLRAIGQQGPRWWRFYQLSRALPWACADHCRYLVLRWAQYRWPPPMMTLSQLPCGQHPEVAAQLAALDRACFGPLPSGDDGSWRSLASPLGREESSVITLLCRLVLGRLAVPAR